MMHVTQKVLRDVSKAYPRAWKILGRMRPEALEAEGWPAWCWMPMAAHHAVMTAHGRHPMTAPTDMAKLAAIDAWRQTKGMYRFDPDLAAALSATPLKGDLPTDLLKRMPEWCIFVEISDSPWGAGFFAHLEADANDGREELRLLYVKDSGECWPQPLHLGGSLEDALQGWLQTSEQMAKAHGIQGRLDTLLPGAISGSVSSMAGSHAEAINLLLYLCSEQREMVGRKPGQQLGPPQSKRQRRGKAKKAKVVARQGVQEWDVGLRVGAALRKARQETQEGEEGGVPSGRTVQPHIRRAHWHTYRVGKGRQDRVVKWVSPILVGGAGAEDLAPTVHPVRP